MTGKGFLWLGHLFFPRECVHCGVLLDYRNRGYLCGGCRELLETVGEPLCEICGEPRETAPPVSATCPACREDPPAFRSARSALLFSGAGRSLVLAYKYSAGPYLYAAALRLLQSGGERWYAWRDYDLVVPVPLHPRKVRERGFDQSALLAVGLSRATGIPLGRKTLARVRYTISQTRLSREERGGNIGGAFAFRGGEEVRGKTVLLVDDVYTTGATVNECAKMLIWGGAASVDVLTLARAVRQ